MRTNQILAILAILGGITAAFTKFNENNGLYPDWKIQKVRIEGKKIRFISASHLADLLYQKDQNLLVYDTRGWAAYEQYHIPQALLYDAGMGSKAGNRSGITVIYGDANDQELYELAGELHGRVYLLQDGMKAWSSLVLFPDFKLLHVRNGDQLEHILRRSGFFGGKPQNIQVLNLVVREDRYREGC